MGDSAAALDFIADGIEWQIVGDHTIDGNAAVKEICEDAASQGKASFQNGRVIKGRNTSWSKVPISTPICTTATSTPSNRSRSWKSPPTAWQALSKIIHPGS